nr:MAG TPA: hypothetical protein [Caudoviricetes sp.]
MANNRSNIIINKVNGSSNTIISNLNINIFSNDNDKKK